MQQQCPLGVASTLTSLTRNTQNLLAKPCTFLGLSLMGLWVVGMAGNGSKWRLATVAAAAVAAAAAAAAAAAE